MIPKATKKTTKDKERQWRMSFADQEDEIMNSDGKNVEKKPIVKLLKVSFEGQEWIKEYVQ